VISSEDNQPGVLMAMLRPASLVLGVSETLVRNWYGQRRLPYVRFEVTRTTLLPTAYIAAVRADATSKDTVVTAEQLDAFNATPQAKQLERYARLAFRQLLSFQPSLSAEDIAQLFGFNDMMIGRWVSTGLIVQTSAGLVAPTARLIEQCYWYETA